MYNAWIICGVRGKKIVLEHKFEEGYSPGNSKERPHQPQHPANSGGPLSRSRACDQQEQCGSVGHRGRLV